LRRPRQRTFDLDILWKLEDARAGALRICECGDSDCAESQERISNEFSHNILHCSGGQIVSVTISNWQRSVSEYTSYFTTHRPQAKDRRSRLRVMGGGHAREAPSVRSASSTGNILSPPALTLRANCGRTSSKRTHGDTMVLLWSAGGADSAAAMAAPIHKNAVPGR
jgi:hypothetical protein